MGCLRVRTLTDKVRREDTVEDNCLVFFAVFPSQNESNCIQSDESLLFLLSSFWYKQSSNIAKVVLVGIKKIFSFLTCSIWFAELIKEFFALLQYSTGQFVGTFLCFFVYVSTVFFMLYQEILQGSLYGLMYYKNTNNISNTVASLLY